MVKVKWRLICGIGLIIAALLSSCSSTTKISVSDPMARIYVDGIPKGKETVTITDTKIVGATTAVKISKDNCKPQDFYITKSEKLNIGALIGGIFVLVPFLWIMEYNPEHYYEYECIPVK